jgi:nitrite reductase/ring-hydroxylating ferredoxin subunit/DMSO/TMAO reductase YedYZ heme-binding membrane subunit
VSVQYTWVQWNRHKKVYDAILAGGVLLYLLAFVVVSKLLWTGAQAISDEILVIRATGTCAYVMLHVLLCIGPLARLDRRFAPLLYNRRHFGVTLFGVALVHAVLVMLYYHGFGVVNPLVSLLTSSTEYGSLTAFPFQILGAIAFVVLFLMAATSHDFWLKNLTPAVWKSLHMLVYPAFGLLVAHVALGALQSERSGVYVAGVLGGILAVSGLHLFAGRRELARRPVDGEEDGWVDIGTVDEIHEERAKVVCLRNRERVAVFRHDGTISALSNVCAHQAGPLGEGRVVDGCVTCPWHGYQYLPHNGTSPPPYTETVPTYRVRVEGRRILLNPEPLPPGTAVEPARFDGTDP